MKGCMQLVCFREKGLRQLHEDGNARGVPSAKEAEMRMKNPPHPGDLIKTEVIEALGLNVSKAAEILKAAHAEAERHTLKVGEALAAPERSAGGPAAPDAQVGATS